MKKSFFRFGKQILTAETASLDRAAQPRRTKNTPTMSADEAPKFYEEAKTLCNEKKYEQALKKLSEIEERFSSPSKAVSFLKGHARVEILKERNEFTAMTHMKF